MKRLFFLLVMMTAAMPALAQQESLVGGDSVTYGGFGGAILKMTRIYGESAWMVGARGAWMFNRRFYVGGGAYGLATDIQAPVKVRQEFLRDNLELDMVYGGMELEYIVASNKLVHWSVYSLIGAGNVGFADETASNEKDFDKMDAVFVVEPALNATVNVTKWFRVSAGVSYRRIFDFQLAGADGSDVSGLAGALTLRFGKF